MYVVLGGFLGLRGTAWLWPHAATVAWGAAGVFVSLSCPLTLLQKWLLAQGGVEPYPGTFIDTYVAGVVYPAAWQNAVWSLSALVVLASYAVVFGHRGHERSPAVSG